MGTQIEKKYSRLAISKEIEGYKGIGVICYKNTGKPIDIGPGACYVRAVGSDHSTKRFFKVEQSKGKWNLLVRELNHLEFKSVPELNLLSMEFYFV